MTIESIYIQDNFIPDAASDQYRRKNIGISVRLDKEGDTIQLAEQLAEEYISDYIKRNKVEPPKSGVVSIPFEEIAAIQVPKPDKRTVKEQQEQGMIDLIASCKTIDELKTYEKLSKSNPKFQEAYNETLLKLQ